MKIKCLVRGFYDRNNEKCALIAENAILTVVTENLPAPCRSKEGNGKWAVGFCENSRKTVVVFMENGNFESVE